MTALAGSSDGVVAISGPGTGHDYVGMGILVGPRHVLTCAHVVNCALGLAIENQRRPASDSTLMVSFPLGASSTKIAGRLQCWFPPVQNGRDCAMIVLEECAPLELGVAVLVDHPFDLMSDDRLNISFATAKGQPARNIPARFTARASRSWTQITTDGGGSMGIVSGCSGSAVWDETRQSVIGMVVATLNTKRNTASYIIPAAILFQHLPNLPVQERRATDRTQRSWAILSTLLFVSMLLHFLQTQSRTWQWLLPWGANDEVVTAFFGAHFFAILGPITMGLALIHARSWSRSPWPQRVPAAFRRHMLDCTGNSRTGASIAIFFLHFLPCYAQGHFLRILNKDSVRILANRGIFPNQFAETDCDRADALFCVHPDLGLFRHFSGNPLQDNAYRISGQNFVDPVAFFPMVQPVGALALTLLGWGLFIALVVTILRNPASIETRSPRKEI